MTLGYIVGKQYRQDKNFDRYITSEAYRLLLRLASKRGFSVEHGYSHITRSYTAEVFKLTKLKGSAQIYTISVALKSGSNPISPMIEALTQAFETDGPCDAKARVLFLELEVFLLGIAAADSIAKQKLQSEKLNQALDQLTAVLASVRPKPISYDEDDDL